MNTRLCLTAVSLAAACSAAFAGTEYGSVISSKAVTAPVSVAQQQCTELAAASQPQAQGQGQGQAQGQAQACPTVTTLENRVIGYDVVFDYNGQRYSARMAHNPGERVALNVSVTTQGATAAVDGTALPAAPPLVTTVVLPPPAPAVLYAAPYAYDWRYPEGAYLGPVAPHVGLVFSPGYWHRGR